MEPPMSNSSMGHQNPDLDFDDMGHFLQGALCIIAAQAAIIDTKFSSTRVLNFSTRVVSKFSSVVYILNLVY